ncbi:MAG TPA: ComEC/Rec2 family competence protein [Thermoanaerobaculia bacterium]|nr:ComEC/Rec2 family competence protein [Thermoanaerobaculia bacterium]
MEPLLPAGRLDLRGTPMLLPAAALAAGAVLAFRLAWLPVPLLALLTAAGVALGRRTGWCLAAFAVGLISATVGAGLPQGRPMGLDGGRPVELVARVAGHWTRDEEGWSAPARALRWRQDEKVAAAPFDLFLHLPDEEEPPPFGATLRAKGYLRRSPGFANAARVPPGPWRLRLKSRLLLREEAPPGALAAMSGRVRRRAERAFAAAGRETSGKALARALVLGDPSAVPLAWKRGLRVAGVSHVLSVSGLHLALLAGAVLLAGVWLPRRVRLVLLLPVLAGYLLLVGPLAPLVRSAVMALLAVAALLVHRPPAPANALGWAVALLVLHQPAVVQDPSFQLSVSATAGLLLVAPPLAARWRRLPSLLRAPLAASTGAQLASLPWSLPLVHQLPLAAPLANLVAVPWTAAALLGSLVWSALALLAPALAAAALPALDLLAAPFGWPAEVRPDVWLSLPVATASRAPDLETAPELALFDVGQGEAILLRDGLRAVLVDGGGWERGDLGGRVLLPALAAEGVRRLDALVMTHPDRDHCRGLVDLGAYLPVREVWTAPGWEASGCAGELLTLPGTTPRVLWAGERRRVGRWCLTALNPEAGERRGDNDRSLVLRAAAAGASVLLTGDVEAWAEHGLLRREEGALRADVLKVAHHGSRTSSTDAFLDAVRPRLALISAGVDNPYHHPSSAVLARLAARHVPILRTDRHGMVRLRFPGGGRVRIELPGMPR